MTPRVLFASLAAVALTSQPALAQAQGSDVEARIMEALHDALKPALPFPSTNASGDLPADGSPASVWMVRPVLDGERTVEVLANPLNTTNQTRAAKAMVQIEAAIEAAQQRSQASYEHAVAEAQRTGRSQDIVGITLTDEGVAGARVDAESHVTIDVAFNEPTYSDIIDSAVAPAPLPAPINGVSASLAVPANVYRVDSDAAADRFCAAETHLFFGEVSAPAVQKKSSVEFVTTAAVAPLPGGGDVRSVVVSLRGNDQLISQIVKLADWTRIAALIRR